MISSEAPGAMDVLEQAGFELFDEGVSAVPTPIGLRHVLTANSSGKINLNTARPEVLMALLRSFEDFDEAKEIAWMIYDHGINTRSRMRKMGMIRRSAVLNTMSLVLLRRRCRPSSTSPISTNSEMLMRNG